MEATAPEQDPGGLQGTRAFFDASPLATLVLTPDLRIADVNARHSAITGRPREEIVGRPLFEAFPKNPDAEGPDTEAVIRASVARAIATGEADEIPLQRHDLPTGPGGRFETRFWRMMHSPLIVGGRAVAVRQDSWDVTPQARETQRAEIHRRAASALGEIAYWEHDPATGRIVYSERLEPMFGFEPGTAGDRNAVFRSRIEPADLPGVARVTEEIMDGPLHEARQAEFRVVLPDGETRHMMLRAETALSDEAPAGRVVIGTTVDVTQLRRHEAELEEALEVKAALLLEVNHRVKNSLQLVASILSIGSRTEPEPAVREKLNAAAERVRAVASVHAQLYREDDVRRVDLGAQLAGFCRQLTQSLGAGEAGIDVEIDIASVRVPTETAVALSLVVNELVTNAFKHAFSGPQPPARPRLSVSLTHEIGGKLLLSVEDNGTGGTANHSSDLSDEPHVGTGHGGGMGTRLIASLVAQLGAELTHDDSSGRRTDLSFSV